MTSFPTVSHPNVTPDVTVVLAVRAGEDVVGRDVRALAEQLTALGKTFEIIAVNDGCFDTSFAVLALLSTSMPHLRLLPRDAGGRAFARGISEASGDVVLLKEVGRGVLPVTGLAVALAQLKAGREAVVVRGSFVLGHRRACLPIIRAARGRGDAFERSFERGAFHLSVEVVGAARPRTLAEELLAPVLAPVRRLLAA